MTRQDVNQTFLHTAFLDGANATYVEALQAQYEKDPNSVELSWREFFETLGDDAASIEKTASGPSWERPNWPLTPNDDLTHALDGVEKILQVLLVETAARITLRQIFQRALVDEQPELERARVLLDEELLARLPLDGQRSAALATDEKIVDVELGLDTIHGLDSTLERPEDARHYCSSVLRGSTPCSRSRCATRSEPVRSQRS